MIEEEDIKQGTTVCFTAEDRQGTAKICGRFDPIYPNVAGVGVVLELLDRPPSLQSYPFSHIILFSDMLSPMPVEETSDDSKQNRACLVALGALPADPADPGVEIVAAKKDLNTKGNGPHWFRMVYRDKRWIYVSTESLPKGNLRASERRAEVRDRVYFGEIVVQHSLGKKVDSAWLVEEPDSEGRALVELNFHALRDGNIRFDLPDGSVLTLPDPRKRDR